MVQCVCLLKMAQRPFSNRVMINGLKVKVGDGCWKIWSIESFDGVADEKAGFTRCLPRFRDTFFMSIWFIPIFWMEVQDMEIISTTLLAFSMPSGSETKKLLLGDVAG